MLVTAPGLHPAQDSSKEKKARHMNLRIYRNLYWANRGLLQAINALAELSNEPGLSRSRLRHTQAMIEETRAWMNSDLAECIEQHETDRAALLDHSRWAREQKMAGWAREQKTTRGKREEKNASLQTGKKKSRPPAAKRPASSKAERARGK